MVAPVRKSTNPKALVDNPKKENFWLGRKGTMLLGLATVAAHGWFLYFLEVEYTQNYEATPHVTAVRDYVSLWVPIFIITFLLEALYFRMTAPKSDVYRLNDSLGSLCLGSYNQLFKKLLSQVLLLHGPYAWVWMNYGQYISARFPVLQNHYVAWWVMFLAVEFAYYWVHRTGHTINAFWAMHGVHHSAEAYNLTTALRQSTFHMLVSFVYYVPAAFFFPPPLFLIHNQFNLLYQYWIHTQVIGKLGPLEYILNTPSQHRVHHGRNEYCIDTNYGGTLCIFDRLFGTFQEEIDEVPVVFGITHSLNTFEPIKGNLLAWKGIIEKAGTVNGFWNKFLCFWNGPGWIAGTNPPEEYTIPPCTRSSVKKYDTTLTLPWKLYLTALFTFGTVALQVAGFGMNGDGQLYWFSVIGAFYCGLTYFCIGLSCDLDTWTIPTQIIHAILGAIYFIYGIVYLQETGVQYKNIEIATVLFITISTIVFVILFRRDIIPNKHNVRYGFDLPETEISEKAQWELVPGKKVKVQ